VTATAISLTGTPISPGVAFGYVVREEQPPPLDAQAPEIPAEQVDRGVARLNEALLRVSATLEEHIRTERIPTDFAVERASTNVARRVLDLW